MHPERFSHAVCMSCRRFMCQECTTQWDGINYCVECVVRQRPEKTARTAAVSLILMMCAAAAAAFGIVRLIVVIGASLAGAF